MYTSVALHVLFTATVATASVSKDYLRKDPLFAGSIIKYCEKSSPSSCETIDRRKEALPDVEKAEAIKQISSKLAEISSSLEFGSLSVQNEKLDLSFEFKQSQVPRK